MGHFSVALRRLLKQPGFTATTMATLALCLGANLTMFAVVDGVLLRSLPYADPDRLVTVYHTYPKAGVAHDQSSITSYFERRGQLPALESIAAINQATAVLGEPGHTTIEPVGRVTPEFFATLGTAPVMGRPFREDELTYQTDHVAIVSHEFWTRRLGADPDILGRPVRLDGIPRLVVGVLPPGFRFLSFVAPVYMPLSSEEAERNLAARHSNSVIQVARLRTGATLADAQAQLDAQGAANAGEFPQAQLVADAGFRALVAPLHADHVASVRPMLGWLQGGALLLLVIGGVNLVNLLLVRASGRAQEIAIRRAIGATRSDLVRGVLAETMVLSLSGGLLGLAVGDLGIRLLSTLGADRLPLGVQIAFDGRVALLALGGALAGGLLLGLPTIWYQLRQGGESALQTPRGSTIAPSTHRLRAVFIVAQIALAFVLLTGAGLLGLSLQRAMSVAPGFRTDHVLTGQFKLPWQGYHDLSAFRGFFDRLQEHVARLPGVVVAGAVSSVPLHGSAESGVIAVPGYTPPAGEAVVTHARFGVAGDYFAAMGIPLREGRYLNALDVEDDQQNVVVDERLARRYWPQESALGKQIYRDVQVQPGERPFAIVGVVGAVKHDRLTEADRAGSIYFAYSHTLMRNYFVVARTAVPPQSLAPALEKAIRGIDPELPLSDVRSMDVRIDESLVERRSPALLAVLFGATALLLACIGLYGVMAHSVAQRTREFGIRMALGAQRGQVLGLVFRQGTRLTALGLALGLACGLALAGYVSSLLYGVSAREPMAFGGVALLFGAVAALAALLPARRAIRVDPMDALRSE